MDQRSQHFRLDHAQVSGTPKSPTPLSIEGVGKNETIWQWAKNTLNEFKPFMLILSAIIAYTYYT